MSNRLIQSGRIPLIPDPEIAIKASQVFFSSREQTEKVLDLGEAYFNLLSSIRGAFRSFGKTIERAAQIRSLSAMDDSALADIGIRRDQLPQFFGKDRHDNADSGHGLGSIYDARR